MAAVVMGLVLVEAGWRVLRGGNGQVGEGGEELVGAAEDQRAEGGRRRSNREITQGLLEADLAIMSQQCYLSAGTRLQKVGEEADGWRRTGILGRLGGVGDLNMHEATSGATLRVAGCLGILAEGG